MNEDMEQIQLSELTKGERWLLVHLGKRVQRRRHTSNWALYNKQLDDDIKVAKAKITKLEAMLATAEKGGVT